jgi:hypothetical protein
VFFLVEQPEAKTKAKAILKLFEILFTDEKST